MSFESFQLPPFLHKSLKAMNFNAPTPIQAKSIPVGLEGKDVMGMAQTGTGKTAAFSIPLTVRLNDNPQQAALILAPTRELAQQIYAFIRQLVDKNQSLKPALLVGGAPMGPQQREIHQGRRIFVATPGRLVDHLRHNPQMLKRASLLVLDEADRMLDMGFLPQLKIILKALPRDRQTMMFSATFAPDVKRLAQENMRQPVQITVGEPSRPVEKIEHTVIEVVQSGKNELLLDQLNARQGSVLIFTRTKHRTDRLNRYLEGYGYSVTRIHGNRTLAQRRNAIEGFRSGEYRILVATDIAARGLDIADISHVINYDLPQVAEDYIHRIGRTGRNGKGGQALCFITPEDRLMWRSITRLMEGKAVAGGPVAKAAATTPSPAQKPSARRPPGKRPSKKKSFGRRRSF